MKVHYHVHSFLGGGYLCECDEHYPLTAKGRDAALREERNFWRDYAADSNPEFEHIVITGSILSGGFSIDDTLSMGWSRAVESWSCDEAECLALLDR
jgi:hypothetical protein